MDWLWVGHGLAMGYMGYLLADHGLAMGWLWADYGLAMGWLLAMG